MAESWVWMGLKLPHDILRNVCSSMFMSKGGKNQILIWVYFWVQNSSNIQCRQEHTARSTPVHYCHHQKACFLWVASVRRKTQSYLPLLALVCCQKACFLLAARPGREMQSDILHAPTAHHWNPLFHSGSHHPLGQLRKQNPVCLPPLGESCCRHTGWDKKQPCQYTILVIGETLV